MVSISEMLLRELAAIVGEECWGVVGGEGTGSVILLHIGERTLRRRPIPNPHLADLVRRYDSAYTLKIESAWRIESLTEVVSGSHMPNTNDGKMKGLAENLRTAHHNRRLQRSRLRSIDRLR